MTTVISSPNSTGLQTLIDAVQAKPYLSINFMPYGIVLQHSTEGGMTEKIVSPEDIAKVLVPLQKPEVWSTDVLIENTILVSGTGDQRVVVEYRPPQKTGLWLEGSDEPLRIPMPGLLLIRSSDGNRNSYKVFAVKSRPSDVKAKLYAPPLPNVYPSGVCWGSVAQVSKDKRHPVNLQADWQIFLGSKFGDHSCDGKSQKHRSDIRKLLVELDTKKARKYPADDLVDLKTTLEHALKGMVS